MAVAGGRRAPHERFPLIRETSQHAGHADIIRESFDGATTAQLGTY